MIPTSEELQELIFCPVEWDAFYLNVQQNKQSRKLLEALYQLPPSSVRDARISPLLRRFGQREDALALVYQHTACPLCKAVYYGQLVNDGDENVLRSIVEHFRPDWPLKAALVRLEAKYRAYLTLAIACSTLKKISESQAYYIKALQIADIFEYKRFRDIVHYECGWTNLYHGDIAQGVSVFGEVVRTTPANTTLHDRSAEYATIGCWLENTTPSWLPKWSRETLKALRHKAISASHIDAPVTAATPYMVAILAELRSLTREFHLKLPLFHVIENQQKRQASLQTIRDLVGEDVGEVLGFLSQSALALALSMNHDLNAINILKSAFKAPQTGIGLMAMVYFANLIQIHANLPTASKSEVQPALQTMTQQFRSLAPGQREWLIQWMTDFTPVSLYLLSKESRQLQEAANHLIVVDSSGARRAGSKIKTYPKAFMMRYIENLLCGAPIPIEQRHQAHRHRHALEALGSPYVIYQPIIEKLGT